MTDTTTPDLIKINEQRDLAVDEMFVTKDLAAKARPAPEATPQPVTVAEALQQAIDAIQELSFSADTDLECAKLDGLTDAAHILEGMIEDMTPRPSRDQELTSPYGDNNPPV